MSNTICIEQAESCARAADAAPLADQRETLLRSRSVWLGLAVREEMIRTARAERERDKEQAND